MGRSKGIPSHNRIDIQGHKYHRLTVLENVPSNRYGKAKWKCLCDCGNFHEATTSDLRSGNTKSCGCWEMEERTIRAKSRDRNSVRLNQILGSYKSTARSKGNSWELSDDRAIQLFQMDCFYCGSKPGNKRVDYTYKDEFTLYNGIDRLNNEEGYKEGNVVTACFNCNEKKKVDHFNDFVNWINLVHSTLNHKLSSQHNRS